jgi:hypothetical protein
MFWDGKERKQIREIEQNISGSKQALRALSQEKDPEGRQRRDIQKKLRNQEQLLRIRESQYWLNKARKNLIDVPNHYEDPKWWDNDQEEDGIIPEYALTYWLSEAGKMAIARSIRTANKERIELYVKIIVALTGLGGTAIGIISAIKH